MAAFKQLLLGPLFPYAREAWYWGFQTGAEKQGRHWHQHPVVGGSCNHIRGQLALPGSGTEVIPTDTAKLPKLEGEILSITLLLSVLPLLGNRDLFYVSQWLSRSCILWSLG